MIGDDHNQGEGHQPVDHNGRTVCTCGDFNCASLDAGIDLLAALRRSIEKAKAYRGEVAS